MKRVENHFQLEIWKQIFCPFVTSRCEKSKKIEKSNEKEVQVMGQMQRNRQSITTRM